MSRLQFEAWRASQAQAIPQPRPQMTSAGPVDVASNDDDFPPHGVLRTSPKGEIIDSEGEPADPTVAGILILDNLKMSEEEQREYDEFSLASSLCSNVV